eukprot:gene17524-23842_t
MADWRPIGGRLDWIGPYIASASVSTLKRWMECEQQRNFSSEQQHNTTTGHRLRFEDLTTEGEEKPTKAIKHSASPMRSASRSSSKGQLEFSKGQESTLNKSISLPAFLLRRNASNAVAAAATALAALNADSALPAYIAAAVAEVPTVAQQELIAAHDVLMSAYMLEVSNASGQLSVIVEKQALFDAQVVSLDWVPPPSNDTSLLELNNILEDADVGITIIQQDISTASGLYEDFNTKMNTYKNFENLVATQLEQLDLFLESDEVIDSQEIIVSELYYKTNLVISDYKNLVHQNNVKTMDV